MQLALFPPKSPAKLHKSYWAFASLAGVPTLRKGAALRQLGIDLSVGILGFIKH